MDNIFLQISALLAITVTIAVVMRFLRQPLLVAYLIAGMIAGPMLLNIVGEGSEAVNTFAQFGVVLLLFVIGLNLNLDHIRRIGKVVVITGTAQAVFTGVIGFFFLRLFGFGIASAAYLAVAVTFSSTIIIVKLLSDKKDEETVYGRHTIGLMIVQDIIAIFVMMVITTLGGTDMIGLELAQLVGKLLAVLALTFILARFIAPRLLKHAAASSEFLFLFTIAWCFGIASMLYWLGFSLEIGAIVAGLTLASTPYQPEIASRVKPLRDFFLIIFFLILGSEMSLVKLDAVLIPGILLSAFILIGNPFILYTTFRALRFTRRNSFLAGVTAAQVSEFGFVLLVLGEQTGHIVGDEIKIFTLVALATIVVSSYLITYNEQIYRFLLPLFRIFGQEKFDQPEVCGEVYDVFVFGYHRIGWKICESLKERGIRFAVVDFNPEAIEKLRRRHLPAFFGDAADVEFLESIPVRQAKLVISTIPAVDDQKVLVEFLKTRRSRAKIICNLYHSEHLSALYNAGADYVMMPHLLGGAWVAGVLRDRPWTAQTFRALRKEQQEEMKLRFTAATTHGS